MGAQSLERKANSLGGGRSSIKKDGHDNFKKKSRTMQRMNESKRSACVHEYECHSTLFSCLLIAVSGHGRLRLQFNAIRIRVCFYIKIYH